MADLSITATQVKRITGTPRWGTAAETITAGQPVYIDDGKLRPAVATSAYAADAVGVALNGGAVDQPIEYLLLEQGAVIDLGAAAAAAAGKIYVVSGSAGGLSPHTDATTPATGEYATVVGVGIGNNRVALGKIASGVAAA